MRVLINNGPVVGGTFVDYTRYVVDGTLTIEDSINVPTLVSFILEPTDNAFVVPRRSAYVKVVSDIYASGSGYGSGKILATGFITNEPDRTFKGFSKLSRFNFQQYSYEIKVTSDEWILNTRTVPWIPAFVNQTDSQILTKIAQALMPGFFDLTSQVGTGTLVPYYQYDPTQTWSDIAKFFADANRYHYKIINRQLIYQPFGDKPLGIAFNDQTMREGQLAPNELVTGVVTVPPVNDCIVLGATEPQTNCEDYFIGDGFTSNFQLKHQVFQGTSAQLLTDDWTEASFTQGTWTVNDPAGVILLANAGQAIGALNIVQKGSPGVYTPQSIATYIQAQNGLELGGGINLQHGQVTFNDACEGLIGALYGTNTFTPGNCLCGFAITGSPSINVVVTASGASGIIIQPVLNGQLVGPQIVTKINHQYVLQTWIGAQAPTRFTRPYTNLTQTATYGGQDLTASGTITFVITDIDIGNYVVEQQNPLFGLFPAAPPPVITKYIATGVSLPPFALYCLVNAINLNASINYTVLSLPPQGFLTVQSLTGASGGNLPWKPSELSIPLTYQLGFGMVNQTAQISQSGEAYLLSFYTDDIPAVGSRIRFQSWSAGQAIARVQDPIAIANEAAISGDDGIRSAIMSNLTPQPRTSAECEAAAAAAILDREYPQFQGTYTVSTVPLKFENLFSPSLYQYPQSGRFLYINSPMRAVTGTNFFANTVRIQVVELRQEVMTISIDYGPDTYIERLLPNFLERSDNLLVPKQTVAPPNPIFISEVLNASLPTLDAAQIVSQVNSTSGNYVLVDLGAPPITACEVRYVDSGWGNSGQGSIGVFTSQQFTLPRTIRDQTWYVRAVNGSKFSRYSKKLRVVAPLVPAAPAFKALSQSNLVLDYAGDVRDIYGIELRLPAISGSINIPISQAPVDQPGGRAGRPIQTLPGPNGVVSTVVAFNRIAGNYAAGVPSKLIVTTADGPPARIQGSFTPGTIVTTSCPTNSGFAGIKIVVSNNTRSVNLAGVDIHGNPTSSPITVTDIVLEDYGFTVPSVLGFPNGTTDSSQLNAFSAGVGLIQQYFGFFNGVGGNYSIPIVDGVLDSNVVATLTTSGNHSFNVGDTIVVGVAWNTTTPPTSSNDSAFYTGQRIVTAIPAPNKVSFIVKQFGGAVPSAALTGYAGTLLAGTGSVPSASGNTLTLSANGVLIQRAVFAPSDLSFDLTDSAIQSLLQVAQQLSPSGFQVNAYFFNLTWDYSEPLNILNVSVPVISGLLVDAFTQQAQWQIVSGRPLGTRIEVIDPVTGTTFNRFTIDNPVNPQALSQFQLSAADYAGTRLIKATPFTVFGDGPSQIILHAGGVGASGTPNTSSYSIGTMYNGIFPASGEIIRAVLDQKIQFADNFVPSQSYIKTPATSSYVWTIMKNFTQVIGTLTFAPGAVRGTFSGSGITFGVGDVITVLSPATLDATARDLSITLSATKVFS